MYKMKQGTVRYQQHNKEINWTVNILKKRISIDELLAGITSKE
ncbi:hypothetical protein [Virgibacillus sp. DJP39]